MNDMIYKHLVQGTFYNIATPAEKLILFCKKVDKIFISLVSVDRKTVEITSVMGSAKDRDNLPNGINEVIE